MLTPLLEKRLLKLLSGIHGKGELKSRADLWELPTRELLELLSAVPDEVLPLVIHTIKAGSPDIFEKIMGDHEKENKNLVDSFFSRYQQVILADSGDHATYNPLEYYLPVDCFADLVFVQSRQQFFERQTCATINEYFETVLSQKTNFEEGDQAKAWMAFWDTVLKHNP